MAVIPSYPNTLVVYLMTNGTHLNAVGKTGVGRSSSIFVACFQFVLKSSFVKLEAPWDEVKNLLQDINNRSDG
jgi:hypothetical protein